MMRGGDQTMQPEYIRRLANSVARNLQVPHRFICFADDPRKVPDGIETLPLDVPWKSRALPKAYIYGAPNTGCPIEPGTGILIFDLDTVIVGDIGGLVDHGHDLVSRERIYLLPRLVPDGCTIFSRAGSAKANACARIFHAEIANKGATTNGGDERELLCRAGAATWGRIRPGQVLGYKKHCRGKGLPEGARVVSFHGKPLPDQAPDAWIKEHWR